MDNPFDLHDKESATSGAFLLPTDSEILEGFLCPVCKRDLRTPERLTVHVEHEHSEEQDLLKSLKEIFSLARQGILKGGKRKPAGQQGQQQQGAEGSEPSPPSRYGAESGVVVGSAGTANNPLLQPGGQQPAGCTCEHMAYFRAMQDWRRERPLLRQYYEALERERTDIEPHIGMYRRILDSLYEGDVIYRLSDASALRERIGRSAEKLDGVSKSLQTLPTAPGSREEALKKAIRLGCIAYIKERMLSIPPLPVEDEIKRIQARKRTETERRLERERQLALEAFERLELQAGGGAEPGTDRQNGSSSSSSTASTAEMTNGRYGAAVSTMDNWSGTQAHGTGGTSDPLIDQINIVKGYIRQARAALRFEEVATLERNLSELTQEFYHRQRQDTDTKQPETS
uniref:C2H2-type domain-containing protein n=1 Tax=Anopheles coluzzii TaxID=1518534 RepID=A0A8W7PW97_ANOCL